MQNKILKQHKDRLSGFLSQTFRFKEEQERTLLLTEMYNGNTFEDKVPVEDLLSSMETSPKEASQGVQPRMIEEDRVYSRAQITNPEEDNKLSNESFEQSKKDALNLVTSENEKFTKGDKNIQGLKFYFKGCYFTTSVTLKKV